MNRYPSGRKWYGEGRREEEEHEGDTENCFVSDDWCEGEGESACVCERIFPLAWD